MGQFTVTPVVSGAAITAAKINEIIQGLKNAYNKLTADNFDSSTGIPLYSLQDKRAYQIFDLARTENTIAGTAVTPVAITDYLDEFVMPADMKLVKVKIIARTVSVNPCSVDITVGGATPVSILTAPVILATGNHVTGDGVIAKTDFSTNDILSLHADTQGGKTIDGLHVLLLFKSYHVS